MKHLLPFIAITALIGCGSGSNSTSPLTPIKNDINGDGYADIIVGDPRTANQAGKVSILFGPDFSQSHTISAEAEYDLFATDLDASGDINGDGIIDLVVSAMEDDQVANTNQDGGKAYVFYGTTNTTQLATLASNADVIITSTIVEGEILGGEITLGDLNGDGFDDVIVANGRDGDQLGKLFIFNGSSNGINNTDGQTTTAQASATISGTESRTAFGVTSTFSSDEPGDLLIGDINQDSIDDLVVGSPRMMADQARTEGYVHIFYGQKNGLGTITVDNANVEINGAHITDNLRDNGAGLTIADFNNDTVMDLGFGHPDSLSPDPIASSGYTGGYSIFFGPLAANLAGEDADVIINSLNGSEDLGSEAVAADFNGDGIMDIAIGDEEGRHNASENQDPLNDAGAVYIFFGPDMASGDISDADVTINGVVQHETVGRALATGDYNDDGITDLVIGAEQDTNTEYGYVYIFHGRTTWGSDLTTANADASLTDSILESAFGSKLAE